MDNKKSIVCFGEVLWDVLEADKKPGGAPMNVAYHLNSLGHHATMVSAVGDDENGSALTSFLQSKGLPLTSIQIVSDFPTGLALARRDSDHEIRYDIVEPAAWDNISPNEELTRQVAAADILVFGSLGLRSARSRDTLLSLLSFSPYRVFDINLRPPHYTPELVLQLFQHADLIKMNEEELSMVVSWLSEESFASETEMLDLLLSVFPDKELIVSRGARGASYYAEGISCSVPAIPVSVVDTIGSGDSFLAAFLSKKLEGADIEEAMRYATAMGAFITSQAGACPSYDRASFDVFRAQHAID